tara:strand:- start:7745 stop:8473 length:729 start_codon:yes stop_codon:yes gene_type:complete
MSNYTKSTNFATKDNLAAGNALKRVKGAEIDDEFNALSVAIATKANTNNAALTGTPIAPTATTSTNSPQIATTAYVQSQKVSPAFTGTPTSPTASVGANTTQVATTAFVHAAATAAVINALVYPVGSIYTAVVSTNPATLLGVGTWAAFGSGRTLVGINTSDSDFNTVEEVGGSKTHTLTVAEIPAHAHTQVGTNGTNRVSGTTGTPSEVLNGTSSTGSAGSGAAHTIMQPYIVVYMWKRTA